MKTPLEQLRDLDYKTESHTFSKGVIAAYYNAMEYPTEIARKYITVKRRKDRVHFFFDKNWPPTDYQNYPEKDTIYYVEKSRLTPKKIKEVVYDLDKIFTNPSKQVRRGMKLHDREDVRASYILDNVKDLYEEWQSHKMNDGKTYRIAFTPKRYLRAFSLADLDFNIEEFGYFVKDKLYGALCYEVQGDIAFELAFISRFWDKDLKLTNDQNELILINSFYELWKKGIKRVNVGTSAGIKGLKIFKNKLPHEYVEIYSN